jgi:hypothetical protein
MTCELEEECVWMVAMIPVALAGRPVSETEMGEHELADVRRMKMGVDKKAKSISAGVRSKKCGQSHTLAGLKVARENAVGTGAGKGTNRVGAGLETNEIEWRWEKEGGKEKKNMVITFHTCSHPPFMVAHSLMSTQLSGWLTAAQVPLLLQRYDAVLAT